MKIYGIDIICQNAPKLDLGFALINNLMTNFLKPRKCLLRSPLSVMTGKPAYTLRLFMVPPKGGSRYLLY